MPRREGQPAANMARQGGQQREKGERRRTIRGASATEVFELLDRSLQLLEQVSREGGGGPPGRLSGVGGGGGKSLRE